MSATTTCRHIEIERTPGFGHSVVRCVACHKPGIRTWDKDRQPVVTWEENIKGLVDQGILGDDEALARVRVMAEEAGHDFGPAEKGVIVCRTCDLIVTEPSIVTGLMPCKGRKPAIDGLGEIDPEWIEAAREGQRRRAAQMPEPVRNPDGSLYNPEPHLSQEEYDRIRENYFAKTGVTEEQLGEPMCGDYVDMIHKKLAEPRTDGRRVDWDNLSGDQKMAARLDGTEFVPLTLEQRVIFLEAQVALLQKGMRNAPGWEDLR